MLSSLTGLEGMRDSEPTVETVGYFRSALRDWIWA
jgi:hypothetical protein